MNTNIIMNTNKVIVSFLETFASTLDPSIKTKIPIISDILYLLDTNDTMILKKINEMISELKEFQILSETYKQQKNVYINIDPNFNDCLKENSRKSEWVYFLREGNTDNIKIGLTKNLQKRIKTLQTGNSNILSLVAYIEAKNMYELETKFHKYFEYCNGSGEWFNIPNEVLVNTLLQYRSIEDDIFNTANDEIGETHILDESLLEISSQEIKTVQTIKIVKTINPIKTIKTFYKHIYDTKPAWYIENGRVELSIIEKAYRDYFNDQETTKLVISRQLNNNMFVSVPNTARCSKKILVPYADLKKIFR